MRKIALIIPFLSILLIVSSKMDAQNRKVGAAFLMDYSIYRWDQRPAGASIPAMPDNYSLGQAMNLLPGVSAGAWFGHQKWFQFSFDAGIAYYPLSLDLGKASKPKGTGVLAFPLLAKFHCFLASSARHGQRTFSKTFIYAGFGREWVLTGLHIKEGAAVAVPYALHIVEIGLGTGTDGFSSMVFLRGGWNKDGALLFNGGLKFAWETGN